MNKYFAVCFIWFLVVAAFLGTALITKSNDLALIIGFLGAILGLTLTEMILKNDNQEERTDEDQPKKIEG